MLQLPALGPISTILLVLALAGVISWGVTQGLKKIILWWDQTHHESWWFNIVVRSIAIVVGCATGYLALPGVLGALLGAAGGILNTTIVMVVRSKLKTFDPNAAAAVAEMGEEPCDVVTPNGTVVVSPDQPEPPVKGDN